MFLILLKQHGIKIIYSRLRTPRTQGLVEQGNFVVKDKLCKWVSLLPFTCEQNIANISLDVINRLKRMVDRPWQDYKAD